MLEIKKHKLVLVQILKDIYADKEIGPILGLKGGTAVYLFYNLPRFSVDLDLNLLDQDKKDLIFKKLAVILKRHGQIKQKSAKRFTLFFFLSYGAKATNIKVEVSTRQFPNHYEVKNYLGLPILVMKKEDIFAHKLVALLDRKEMARRDLFDLWFFFKNNWPINKALVALRTRAKFPDYFKKCIKAVEKADEKYILQGLGEVLSEELKTWTKENLQKDLLFLMRYYLKNA